MSTFFGHNKNLYKYERFDTYIAGLVLDSREPRFIWEKGLDLTGSWVAIRNGEAWLIGATIVGQENAICDRKLLLTKRELNALAKAVDRSPGMTIIPTSCFLGGKYSSKYIKVQISTAKGKKLHDNREKIRKRDLERYE